MAGAQRGAQLYSCDAAGLPLKTLRKSPCQSGSTASSVVEAAAGGAQQRRLETYGLGVGLRPYATLSPPPLPAASHASQPAGSALTAAVGSASGGAAACGPATSPPWACNSKPSTRQRAPWVGLDIACVPLRSAGGEVRCSGDPSRGYGLDWRGGRAGDKRRNPDRTGH